MKKQNIVWYILTCATVFGLDRLTKYWALQYLPERYTLNDVLSFELAFNRGISWGMFGSGGQGMFVLISVVIMCVIGVLAWYVYTRIREGHTVFAELLVLTGAVSNLIDRFVYDGVVDFIALSYGNYTWPLFNVADACIVFGVGIMLLAHYNDPS